MNLKILALLEATTLLIIYFVYRWYQTFKAMTQPKRRYQLMEFFTDKSDYFTVREIAEKLGLSKQDVIHTITEMYDDGLPEKAVSRYSLRRWKLLQ